MRILTSLIGAAIGIALAAHGGATELDPVAGCGHLGEIAQAKRALEVGREDEALRHLKNADALLARCLREGPPKTEIDSRRARDVGGAEAPPTSAVSL